MKLISIFILGLGLVGLAAIVIRLIPVDAEAQHLDPATVSPPDTPNFSLRRGEGAASVAVDLATTASRLHDIMTGAGGQLLAGDLGQGHASYLFRSRLMGYPDVVSIRLTDASTRERLPEGALTEIEILSRSLMGYSDMGVNRARVDRLLAQLSP